MTQGPVSSFSSRCSRSPSGRGGPSDSAGVSVGQAATPIGRVRGRAASRRELRGGRSGHDRTLRRWVVYSTVQRIRRGVHDRCPRQFAVSGLSRLRRRDRLPRVRPPVRPCGARPGSGPGNGTAERGRQLDRIQHARAREQFDDGNLTGPFISLLRRWPWWIAVCRVGGHRGHRRGFAVPTPGARARSRALGRGASTALHRPDGGRRGPRFARRSADPRTAIIAMYARLLASVGGASDPSTRRRLGSSREESSSSGWASA